jgi:Transglutaminase-like superfamily
MDKISDSQRYYSLPGVLTDPGENSSMLEGLPQELAALCETVQNNLIHVFWAERYGVTLREDQNQSLNIRSFTRKLDLIRNTNPAPLVDKRDLQSRQVGNCRDFSLFLTAFLRFQGKPARARCGFGSYFLPDHYEDHWVCEYWNSDQSRWVMVDAQLDAFQRKTLGIDFDPLDVPHDQFITGGRAWQMCRSGYAKPEQFGIFDMHGIWFIWGNVVRDFLSLNKIEILPWDGGWGYLTHGLTDPLPEETELMHYDQIAALSAHSGEDFHQLRDLMNSDDKFLLPDNYY